ncbi:MAG: glycosyltransferase [Pirellulales bacterium]
MTKSLATVAFVPREVFSTTQRSLETLFERTPEPFDLVCIDGGSPPDVQQYLQREARAKQFTLVRTDHYLTPNQARNLAVEHTRTPYIVFVDNDALVTEGWLTALVDCAEATGAWVVGPKYFEFLPERRRLHMYGGDCRIQENDRGERVYYERHHHAHALLTDVAEPLLRKETELIEFHTVLVSMQAFKELGPLDEGLLCNGEHGDLCLMVRGAGHQVFLEPAAQITYVPPKRLEEADRDFFELRWSEAWALATHRRMIEKWNLTSSNTETARARRWVGDHRRYRLTWLHKLRKLLGPKWTKSIEKRLVAPVEAALNLRRFPHAQFGTVSRPVARVEYSPPSRVIRAA